MSTFPDVLFRYHPDWFFSATWIGLEKFRGNLADTPFWFYRLHKELLIRVILPRLTPLNLP